MSDDAVKIPSGLSGVGGWLDDRFHGARGGRVLMRKVFPDHWSFMLGEIALWSFVILLLTGTYLALFFQPSMADVVLPRLLHQARRHHNVAGVRVDAADLLRHPRRPAGPADPPLGG
jgi:quinol-cytochrome oxidoreductase complex cytochrome b subunit